MEWKPIQLDNIQLKPIYEITKNGDIRRSDTGKVFSSNYDVGLKLVDGTSKHFLREALVEAIFNRTTTEWRPIKIADGLNLSRSYLISEDGHLRRVDTNYQLKYRHMYQLKTKTGKIQRFSTQKLTRMAFPEVNEMLDEHELSVLLQSLNGFIMLNHFYSHICIAISIREKNTITLSHEKFGSTIRVHYDGTNFVVNMLGSDSVESNRNVVKTMITEYITEVMTS